MALSDRTKDVLKIALADRAAGREVAAAIDAAAWTVVALEVTTGTTISAATVALLKTGDIVTAVAHTAGTTTFGAVTANKTAPSLTLTAGDLVTVLRKGPALIKGIATEPAKP